jgi:hypothetical protein
MHVGSKACDMVSQIVAKSLEVGVYVLQFRNFVMYARDALFE